MKQQKHFAAILNELMNVTENCWFGDYFIGEIAEHNDWLSKELRIEMFERALESGECTIAERDSYEKVLRELKHEQV